MTDTAQERQAPAGAGAEQSTTEQAKEKVQEAAGQVQQQAGERAHELRGKAADGVRRQLDTRSTQAGEQATVAADALRRVGGQLREEGNSAPAQYAERAAEPVERLGRYLTQADGERILRDVERFARQRPMVTVLGGATLGFLVARFIKASGTGNGAAEAQMREPGGQAQLTPPPTTATEVGGFNEQPSR